MLPERKEPPTWRPELAEGKRMAAPTRRLHEDLIRLAKSAIALWENWLREQSSPAGRAPEPFSGATVDLKVSFHPRSEH
jgi:hypothetical protein